MPEIGTIGSVYVPAYGKSKKGKAFSKMISTGSSLLSGSAGSTGGYYPNVTVMKSLNGR